jgi:F-type H+-transporting ATPase subunit b
MLEQLYEAEFWVAVAFVIFVIVLVRLGTHRWVLQALDDRSSRIAAELDAARKLHEEAQAILVDAEKRRRQAEAEAQDIIAGAQAEAEHVAAVAKANTEQFVARRTQMAEQKIAQAESQAVADVRAAATDAAVAATDAAVAASERILRQQVRGEVADDLIGKSIREVRSKLK